MTPKEKAKELVEAMTFSCRECDYEAKAKQCALIAVDEMLKLFIPFAAPYYYEVKKEIEKL
jgi:hypothetical protein